MSPPADLGQLLRPRSIAVVGGGRHVLGLVRRCAELGFEGTVWPVHPSLPEIAGRPAFRRLADLPAPPDAAYLAVNRELTVGLVRELARMGAGGAVCLASGFAEAGGRGAGLQAALVEAAGAMPVLGPNCYGLLNYLDGAALWFDQHGGKRVPRGVAILTQSGNVGLNLTMQRRGLPLAYLVTLGNQAVLGFSACLEALVEDARVTAIGFHVEAMDDAAAFDAAARTALAARKPLVALKAGRSGEGAALALGHTGKLAGSAAVADALLARLGVARVDTLGEFLETLRLLHTVGPLAGRDLLALSCSGAEASLVADAAAERRLCFPPFAPAAAESLHEALGELVRVSNPLDYHTHAWGRADRLEAGFAAALGGGFDLSLLLLDLPRADRCDPAEWETALAAWRRARDATGARAGVVATLPECLPETVAERLVEEGIAPLAGIGEALRAAEGAADIGAAQGSPPPAPLLPPAPLRGEPVALDEAEAKELMARFGLPHPGGRRVEGVEGAVAAARELGWPVVLKAVGKALLHKSERDAVALGLRTEAEVAAQTRRLTPLGDGTLLVEPMVTDGVVELHLGVARDPCIGLYLVVGAGGVLVELLSDRAVLLLPASEAEVRAALLALRAAPLLRGYRGRPAGDLDAAVAAVLALARFAACHADRLAEAEVNPLIVRPAGRGAVAADALVRLVPESSGDADGRHQDPP